MRQKSIKKATARAQSAKRKAKKAGIRGQGSAGKDRSIEDRIEQNLAEIRALRSAQNGLPEP